MRVLKGEIKRRGNKLGASLKGEMTIVTRSVTSARRRGTFK